MIANLLPKTKYTVLPMEPVNKPDLETKKPEIPDGIFVKCPGCLRAHYIIELEAASNVCPNCHHHFRLGARERINTLVDPDSFTELDADLLSSDPLQFPGYAAKLSDLAEKCGEPEGVVTGLALIHDHQLALGVMEPGFMMGSMGEVVGEKLTKLVETATERKLPVVIVTASGGARMQEGIISLMQMAKTSAALARHSRAGLLYIPVLTDPTTGGVTASFAMLGDIILAEPGALIGFAGPRVIEQTIKQKLPEGFQRAEFLLEQGFVDHIVARTELREFLAKLLKFHSCCGRNSCDSGASRDNRVETKKT